MCRIHPTTTELINICSSFSFSNQNITYVSPVVAGEFPDSAQERMQSFWIMCIPSAWGKKMFFQMLQPTSFSYLPASTQDQIAQIGHLYPEDPTQV